MLLWPRSIRARDTLVSVVFSAVILAWVAVGVDLAVRQALAEKIWSDALNAVTRISASIREGTLTDPIPDEPGVELIQVVDIQGDVLFASRAARKEKVLSRVRPSTQDRVKEFITCDTRHCHVLTAVRLSTSPDSLVIYAGSEQPWLLSEHRLEFVLGSGVVLLVTLTGLFTWHVVGRTLEPITGIRAQLAEITGTDLSRRVPDPGGEDEIAQLARTANETLARLEHSVEQQRRFASDASHELRTPIAGLRTELESALMYPEDTDLLGTLSAALRDTDRLEEIITDLLLLARLGTGGPTVTERIELSEMVATELELRPPSALLGTDLYSGAVVNGVRMQLVRVLDNLLDNAERYGEGAIDVVVGTQEGQALLMVTDRGQGIPKSDRERVFERFTRLDNARSRQAGGTGLGLAIARDIAMAHGGSLRIEDSPHGARFVLRLPLADRE